jgi:hypothetical protein
MFNAQASASSARLAWIQGASIGAGCEQASLGSLPAAFPAARLDVGDNSHS